MEVNYEQASIPVHKSIEQLWKVIKSSGEIIVAVQDDSFHQQTKIAFLESELESKNSSLQSLTIALVELKDEIKHIDELRAAMKALYEKNHDAQSVINDRNNEIQKLVDEAQLLQKIVAENEIHKNHIEVLNAQNKELTNSITIQYHKLEQYENLNVQFSQLKDELSNYKTILLRKDAEIEDNLSLNKKAEEKIRELQQTVQDSALLYSEFEDLKKSLEELNAQNSDAQLQIELQHKFATTYKAQLDEMTEKMFASEHMLQEAKSHIELLENANKTGEIEEAYKQRETELQQTISDIEKSVSEGIGIVSQTLLKYGKQISITSSNYTERLIQALNIIVDEIEVQHRQKLDVTKERNELVNKTLELEKTIQDSVQDKNENEDNILLNDIAMLRRDLELSELASNQQKQQVVELTDNMVELKNLLSKKDIEIIQTKLELDDELIEVSRKIKKSDNEREELFRLLQVSRNRITNLEDELRFELERNISLKKELRTAGVDDSSIIMDLEKEIAGLKDERQYYIKQLHSLGNTHQHLVEHVSESNSHELSDLTVQLKETIKNLQNGFEQGFEKSNIENVTKSRHQILEKIHNMTKRLEYALQ